MRREARTSRRLLAVLGLFCAFGLAFGGTALAQDLREDGSGVIYTEVIIPDATPPGQTLDKRAEYFAEGKVVDLAQYLGIVYNFLISIAGLVASVMMIVGGFQYLTSGGDAGKIGAAKTRITNALMGLLLVLGAYTILKTINPALVVLKLPSVQVVSTELSFLPWCEDVVSKGLADPSSNGVQPLTGDRAICGSIGVYVPKGSGSATPPPQVQAQPQSRGYCLYRGTSCSTFQGGNPNLRQTCMPKLLTGDEIEKIVAERNRTHDETALQNLRGGMCLTCSALSQEKAVSLGYTDNSEAVCQAWMESANHGPFDTGTRDRVFYSGLNTTVISYCGYSDANNSCVQSDIDCNTAKHNEDEMTVSVRTYFESILKSTKPADVLPDCQGYDEGSSNIVWFDQDKGFEVYNDADQHLEDYPNHLFNVCKANPCDYNVSHGGCVPYQGGFATKIYKLSKLKLGGTYDCDNKGRDNHGI